MHPRCSRVVIGVFTATPVYIVVHHATVEPIVYSPCICDCRGRCGNNYGWSRFEGSRCQEAAEDRLGPCDGVDRSDFTFPIFEYCHPDYDSSVASEDAFTGGVDICAATTLRGNAVIGKSGRCNE